MTIAVRKTHLDDLMIEDAVSLFTTPAANMDCDLMPSSVLDDLLAYQAESRGVGGRPELPGSIRYSLLSVLVAFYLLIRTNSDVSEASAWGLVVHTLTPEQRIRLGVTGDLTGTRYDVIAAGLEPGASSQERAAAKKATQQEYARFAKVFAAGMRGIDPSPYPRDRRLTSTERAGIAKNPEHPMRRISVEEETLKSTRMHAIFNKVVAVAAQQVPDDGYIGDLATDETIVISHKNRLGVGSRPGKNHSYDPDTKYWPGKDKPGKDTVPGSGNSQDPEKGFGYGITYAIRMARPYGNPAVTIPIGIHIGEPTGGRASAFEVAHAHADLHGLTKKNRERYVVADTGYTKLDDWAPLMLDLGYKINADYPSGWSRDVEIPDTNRKGQPAPGPRIIAGRIRCPGATGLHPNAVRIPARGEAPEDAKTIVKRQRTINLLEGLAMPVRNGLRRVKSVTRGRPKTGQVAPDLWTVTVQCPAALGLVNCVNAPRVDGLMTSGVPDVPNPPFPGQPDLWPKACTQESVTYQLDIKTIKRLQAETHGSYFQDDLYETMRSANERFHSQFKHSKSGGITDRNWVELRGIAKKGLLFSIATAVTTGNMIDAFNAGEIDPSPREIERRRRSGILKRLRQQHVVSAARKKAA
jgi:hypothetical protein